MTVTNRLRQLHEQCGLSKEQKVGVNTMLLQECVKFWAVLHTPSGMLLTSPDGKSPTIYDGKEKAQAYAESWVQSTKPTYKDDVEVVQVRFQINRDAKSLK